MAGILDTVDQRTQLVGENRLEILMFRLAGRQLFAINVFKVQEVLQLPKLTLMPQRHPFVCGVVNLRGQTLPVIDLSQAIGMAIFDWRLLPISSMASTLGPMNVRPACSQARANSAFSERKP